MLNLGKLLVDNSEHCEVNALNVNYIYELPWPNLINLFLGLYLLVTLGSNSIGNNGIKLLSKANMPELKLIKLGIL